MPLIHLCWSHHVLIFLIVMILNVVGGPQIALRLPLIMATSGELVDN